MNECVLVLVVQNHHTPQMYLYTYRSISVAPFFQQSRTDNININM